MQLVVFKFYGSEPVYIVYTFDFNAMRCSTCANLLARGKSDRVRTTSGYVYVIMHVSDGYKTSVIVY